PPKKPITPEEAAKWLEIDDFIKTVREPTKTITDLNDKSLSFDKPLLEKRDFKARVVSGFFRDGPSPVSPEVATANSALSAYVCGSADDAKGFLADYDARALTKGFADAGTFGNGGVVLQDAAHVDILFPVDNTIVRVNLGGDEKFPKAAAVKDATATADAV